MNCHKKNVRGRRQPILQGLAVDVEKAAGKLGGTVTNSSSAEGYKGARKLRIVGTSVIVCDPEFGKRTLHLSALQADSISRLAEALRRRGITVMS